MEAETCQIISDQSGETDLLLVEKTYFQCNGDIGATVLRLMDYKYQEREQPPRTKFDEMREILDEKDAIFQSIIEKSRK
jgi:hypothetical protein